MNWNVLVVDAGSVILLQMLTSAWVQCRTLLRLTYHSKLVYMSNNLCRDVPRFSRVVVMQTLGSRGSGVSCKIKHCNSSRCCSVSF